VNWKSKKQNYTLKELTEFMNRKDIGLNTIDDVEIAEYVEEKLNKKRDWLDLGNA